MPSRRRTVLIGVLALLAVLATLLLRQVLATVFFAVTVTYVLYPLREALVDREIDARVAAGVSTALAFLAVAVLLLPVGVVVYLRRGELVSFLQQLPESVGVDVFGMEFVVESAAVVEAVRGSLAALAVDAAQAAPVVALKLFLFALVVYALLLRPMKLRETLLVLVPDGLQDVVLALHERVRSTLYAIYVLQAATAVATFVAGYAVFAALGFRSAFALAVVAGILQFIPIVGPSIVVVGLAAVRLSAGNIAGAVLVLVFGLVIVGFLPDAVIRTRVASATAGMPGSLYFVGFVGGVLSLGVVGVIAGPLVVGLLVEAVDLVSANLSTAGPEAGTSPDASDPGGGPGAGDEVDGEAGPGPGPGPAAGVDGADSTGPSVSTDPTDETPASDVEPEDPGTGG